MPNAWLLPILGDAVVIGVNLPNFTANFTDLDLKIPRETLADIFLGRIRRWDHTSLSLWNPPLAHVHEDIALVVRSDPCAVSETLSDALSSFSVEWRGKVGRSSRPRWPQQEITAADDQSVALGIIGRPYSLGFLSQNAAKMFKLRMAHISTIGGTFVAPNAVSVQSAMDSFSTTVDEVAKNHGSLFSGSIVDPKGRPGAYPISRFTYILFDPSKLECSILNFVVYLIYWVWTSPQAAAIAGSSDVACIAPAISRILLASMKGMRCSALATGLGVVRLAVDRYDDSFFGAGASDP
jgi:phosphate transport system substrate-binding protein